MSRTLLAVIASLLVMCGHAQAQQTKELRQVVLSCGTPPQTYTPGSTQPALQDANGNECGPGSTGSPSTVTISGTPSVTVASGTVGGYDFFVSTTPALQLLQYVSGNCMGGFQTVSVGSTTGLSGVLTHLTLISKGALVTAKQIYVFTTNPSASTCNDRSTFSIAAADLPKLIGAFSLTPAVPSGGAASVAEATNIVDNFVTAGNASLYFAIIETATETPATAGDLVFNIGGIRDAP